MVTPHLVPPAPHLKLPIDFSTLTADALDRGWFLQADTAQTLAAGQASKALAFQLTQEHYSFMARASFALAKAEFEKVLVARSGPATPSNNTTIGVQGTSSVAGVRAGNAGIGLVVHHQFNRVVGQPFPNLIHFSAVPLHSGQPAVS